MDGGRKQCVFIEIAKFPKRRRVRYLALGCIGT
jgi:hypothetical protein